jgi:hypothetical protein
MTSAASHVASSPVASRSCSTLSKTGDQSEYVTQIKDVMAEDVSVVSNLVSQFDVVSSSVSPCSCHACSLSRHAMLCLENSAVGRDIPPSVTRSPSSSASRIGCDSVLKILRNQSRAAACDSSQFVFVSCVCFRCGQVSPRLLSFFCMQWGKPFAVKYIDAIYRCK